MMEWKTAFTGFTSDEFLVCDEFPVSAVISANDDDL